MIRQLILAAAAVAALVVPAVALDRQLTEEERTLIQNISQYNSGIETMAGRFQQIDAQGGRIEGTFYIERPDKVRFRYGPPSREEIVSQGRGFYVLNRKEETKYAYPQESVPLRQFLTDRINLLQANLSDVTLTEDYISVSLIDESPMGQVEVALVFDRETYDLKQWTLVEPNGAETTFSVYDVVTGVDIPRAYFSIPANYTAPSND